MQPRVRQSIEIWAPIATAASFIAFSIYKLATVVPSGQTVSIDIGIFAIPVLEDQIGLIVLLSAGIVFIIYFFCRDYSRVFPDKLTFSVYFDREGIARLLAERSGEIADFTGLAEGWEDRCRSFHEYLTAELRKNLGIIIDLSKIHTVSGKGMALFSLKKHGLILQNYQIKELSGLVTYEVPVAGKFVKVRSFFEINGASGERFSIGLGTILRHHRFLISPLLRQTYIGEDGREVVIENLFALTWIRFFPFVDISSTLYVAKVAGEFTPIGYCSYDE